MRIHALLIGTVFLALASVDGAQAQRLNYPYCAVYDFRTISCAFNTMAQCRATISGRGGYCEYNVWYQPPAKGKSRRSAG